MELKSKTCPDCKIARNFSDWSVQHHCFLLCISGYFLLKFFLSCQWENNIHRLNIRNNNHSNIRTPKWRTPHRRISWLVLQPDVLEPHSPSVVRMRGKLVVLTCETMGTDSLWEAQVDIRGSARFWSFSEDWWLFFFLACEMCLFTVFSNTNWSFT